MPTLFVDSGEVHSLIRGNKRRDPHITECRNGVTVVPPIPNNEHQDIAVKLSSVFTQVLLFPGIAKVAAGANVSDRAKGWRKNYRCPDVVVYYPENPAVDHNSHWQGGPDFAVEILSKGEDPTAKFGFYAAVGTRELLIVDRKPWALELFCLVDGALMTVGRSTPADHAILASAMVPFTFCIGTGHPRPTIEVEHPASGQFWKA